MEYKTSVLFMLILNGVWSSNCGTQNLRNLFDGGVVQCDTKEIWTFSRPSETIDGITHVSNTLTPSSVSSCITSHTIPMNSGDFLEVNIYTKSLAKEDYVTITVYEAATNKVVGKASLLAERNDFKNGPNAVKISLDGLEKFNGYVMLMGKAAINSILLVESVCFASVALEDNTQRQEEIKKLTSNYRASDIYLLPTDSVLKRPLHPNAASDVIINEIEMIDSIPENRVDRLIDFEDFWTPLTISLTCVIAVVILALIAWGCFAFGKSRGAKQEPQVVYEDVNNIPTPYLVPRVRGVFTESVTGSSYGGRNNNIYSV